MQKFLDFWVLKIRLVCNFAHKLLRPVRIYWQKIRIKSGLKGSKRTKKVKKPIFENFLRGKKPTTTALSDSTYLDNTIKLNQNLISIKIINKAFLKVFFFKNVFLQNFFYDWLSRTNQWPKLFSFKKQNHMIYLATFNA